MSSCFLYWLVFYLQIYSAASSIIPSSVITANINFNGQASQQQIISFQCSETNPSGILIVGQYVVNITCHNPVANYNLDEIARVPAAVDAFDNLICLVPNPAAFQKVLQDAADAAIGSFAVGRRLLSVDNIKYGSHKRGLKQIVDTVLALTALGLSIYNTVAIEKLQGQVGDLQTGLLNVTNQLVGQALLVQSLNTIAVNQQQEIGNLTLFDIGLNNTLTGIINANQGLNWAVGNLTLNTQTQFNALQGFIASNVTALQNFVNYQSNQTSLQFASVLTTVANLTTSLQNQINALNQNLQAGFNNFQLLTVQQQNAQSNTQLIQGITAKVQSLVETISNDMFPFFTDSGVSPSDLVGVDKRNFQEQIQIGYTTPQLASNSPYQIHNTQMNFFIDTGFGLAQQLLQGAFPLQLETMIQFFGTSNCSRSYIAPSWAGPPDLIPDGTTCNFYIEVIDNYCNTLYTPSSYPTKFNWNSTGGSSQIQSSYCVGAGNIQPSISTVIKTYAQYYNYVQQTLCPARGNDTSLFFLSFTRAQTFGFFNPSRLCNDQWDQMLTNSPTTGASLLQTLLYYVNLVWSLANIDLQKKKLKLFGALPGGVDLEFLPYYHLPFAVNATTGVAEYDGTAQPSSCVRANWVSVSRDTLPVYSISPSVPAVTKAITVTVSGLNGFVCQDPSSCYPVGESIITSNIIFNSDSTPPQQPVTFLGSLIPSIAQQEGLFDIPDTEIECATNSRSNENKVCYLKMPPGTTQSFTLPEWTHYIGGTYKATAATASATDFRVPVITDPNGFVLCGNAVQPGILSNITADIHGCLNPFTWQNNSLPNLVTTTTTYNKPTECLQPGTIALFQNLQDSIQRSFNGTSALSFVSGALFSFWIQSPVSTKLGTEVVVVEIRGILAGSSSYLRFIVDVNGMPAVVLSSSATAETGLTIDTRTAGANSVRLLTQNLRDGLLHQVVWISTVANYNTGTGTVTYQLYIDNIIQGTWVSSTGSYIRSSANPFFFQSPLTLADLAGNSDIINLGLMNPTAANVPLANTYSCEQAYFNKMCSQPTQETLLVMRQNVTSTSSVYCDQSSILLLSTSSFDSLYPQSLGTITQLFQGTQAWSVSFWIRLPQNPIYGTLVRIFASSTLFKLSISATQLLSITVNNQIVATMFFNDLLAHFVYVTYSGTTVVVYLDGQLYGSPIGVGYGQGGTGNPALAITPGLNYISMLKYYANEASLPSKIPTEMTCQLDITLPLGSFVPPIGFCEQSTLDPLHGYCRSPLLCDGHCSAYSTIDNRTRTFVVGALNCDDGFQTPDCKKPCARIDPNTGRCIDSSQIYANGPTPLGSICQLTGTSQIEMSLPTDMMYAAYRNFIYSVEIQVPLGTVTSQIGSGGCPQLSFTSFGTNGLLALFQNSAASETNIQVFYGPTSYYLDPTNVQCLSSCCNANTQGKLLSIQPHTAGSVQISTCGNMTIVFNLLTSVSPVNTYSLCSSVSGDSLAAAVVAGNTQQNANLVSTVTTIVDTNSAQLFLAQQAYAVALLNAQILSASLRNASEAELLNLLILKNTILADTTYVNLNFTSVPLINISAGVNNNLATAQNDLNAAANNLAAEQQILTNLRLLQAIVAAELANSTANANALVDSALALQARWQLILALDPAYSGDGSLADLGSALGNFIKNTATGVVEGAEGIVQSGLNSIFGSGGIGGIFSGLIQWLLYGAIAILIIFLIYKLYQCYSNRDKSKKKKQKTDDADDEESQPINHQKHNTDTTAKTSGRITGGRTNFRK